MKQHYSKKPNLLKENAKAQINELFIQAEARHKNQPELSDRYAGLARKIAMRYKVKVPKALKRRICKSCHKYLVFGVNCRVRLNKKKIVYYCLGCRHFMRFPYS